MSKRKRKPGGRGWPTDLEKPATVTVSSSGPMPGMPCPACRQIISAATGISTRGPSARPAVGYLTLCLFCQTWCVFVDAVFHAGLALRRATAEELARLDPAARYIAERFAAEHASETEAKH